MIMKLNTIKKKILVIGNLSTNVYVISTCLLKLWLQMEVLAVACQQCSGTSLSVSREVVQSSVS